MAFYFPAERYYFLHDYYDFYNGVVQRILLRTFISELRVQLETNRTDCIKWFLDFIWRTEPRWLYM